MKNKLVNPATIVFAATILLVAVWIGSGMLGRNQTPPPAAERPLPVVAASWSEAQPVDRALTLYGEVEPTQVASVRSRTDGIVESVTTQGTAVQEGDQWVINGSKRYITNISNVLTLGVTLQVMTNNGSGEPKLTTILVEKGTPGFETKRMLGKMMWRASDTGRAWFNDCRVPTSNLLGEVGQGARYMLKTLDGGRLSVAAMGLGLAQGAFEMAVKHAATRRQFGKPINRNQAISFKLADMDIKLELARNTLYKACLLKDSGQPYTREAAIAKLYTSEIAREIADEAVQIFGGSGLFKDNPIERFYRDQRLLQIGEGTSEILRLVIARNLG